VPSLAEEIQVPAEPPVVTPGEERYAGVEPAAQALPTEEPTTSNLSGINQAAFEQIHGVGEIVPGDVRTGEDWKAFGDQRLANGDDPYVALSRAQKTGAVSPEDLALLGSEHKRLLTVARSAEDANQSDPSPENNLAWENASKDASDFAKSIKPFGTQFANLGRVLQGTEELPLDRLTDYQQIMRERLNRELSPAETQRAATAADRVKDVNNKYQADTQDLYNKADAEFGRIPSGKKVTTLRDLAASFGEPFQEVC
jgi:hypothetical protein